MSQRPALAVAVLAASLALATGARAESRSELGKIEYQSTCADCHGQVGKGDGPYNEFMRLKLADPTTVAQRNGGVFPADRRYEIIDGQAEVKGHGSKQMPVRGKVSNEKAARVRQGLCAHPRAVHAGAHPAADRLPLLAADTALSCG